ncbi:MAG TPA: peroxidase-related enzyme [Roseiflexaceae bacterium]|nr:peroxidase-related enzyme [Roseiflexaceae bacterium]
MTTMAANESTLVPEFTSDDPYCWLSGNDTYQLPAEWLELIADSPEQHSARILASIDQESFARYVMYVNPVFFDPAHGLLSLAERELIGVVVSSINACVTCLIIHGYQLGKYIGDHSRARRIAINYRTVGLSAQERAMADFAVKITEQPGKLEPADLQKLRDVGLSDAKIFYVIEMAGMYNFTNRIMSAYGMRPDDEFMAKIALSG